jgi:hypothetical protein
MSQLDNGVPISSFNGDGHDNELKSVSLLLQEIKECSDVRCALREKYCLTKVLDCLNN